MSRVFTLLFFLISLTLKSQHENNYDSLINIINTTKSDTNKIKSYINLGDYYELTNTDSAKFYYKKAFTYASNIIKTDKHIDKLKATALNFLGIQEFNQGNFDTSEFYLNKSLKILKNLKNNAIINKQLDDANARNRDISLVYNNLGNIYREKGSYAESQNYFFKSLKITEELLNIYKQSNNFEKILEQKMSLSKCYNSIGTVHYFQNNFDKAIGYYEMARKIFEELISLSIKNNNINLTKYKRGISACYNNIAMAISDKANLIRTNKNDSLANSLYKNAITYYFKSLKISEEIIDKKGISKCYNNLGITFIEIKNFTQANYYLNSSLKIKEEIGDKSGIASVWSNIALIKNSLADSVTNRITKFEFYKSAINYGLKSYNLANEISSKYIINASSTQLVKAYKSTGDLKNSLKFAEIVIDTKDSLFNEEKNHSITEIETKYQTEKKQLEIDKLEKQKQLDKETIARKNSETRQQKIINIFILCILIFVITITITIFKLFIDKRKTNKIISLKNSELEQANEEISTQRDEIEAQRDIVVEQKQHIENIHEELTSSIRYAKRIQKALITSQSSINNIISENFVLFLPRDIVSGDFYWATKVKKWLIFCVADCTGHGVPGAFMSMLGISFLNEIVRKEEVTNSADVLNHLRENVINALNQKNYLTNNNETNVLDGMDISLCVLNTENLKLQYSGANNPIYIIKNKTDEQNNQNEIVELKPDKMPISIYINMKPFSFKEYQLNKGDIIYMFSDGFADQFGEKNNKKYKYNSLKNLFLNNFTLNMSQQKEIYVNEFNNWKGKNKQTDDITIVGLKI